ncbi:MAG: ABC transporter permease subunit [Planctomycetia bacterium]|nr:ABC transporter permease subunit [Planctomycetia bacterium]
MYLRENPVLQRELLVNLRMDRAFVLLFFYLATLGAVVYVAWPTERQVDMTRSTAARDLVDLFFAGQFVLASLMAPSFAAGALTGEKERMTYESLLASPLRPGAIILGKLLASLSHLGILVFCSLPIVMLCVPLGGVSFYEVLAAYVALVAAVATFGMISLACSCYFRRTVASLTVSYLIILPLALVGTFAWRGLASSGELRLFVSLIVLPGSAAALFVALFMASARRLLYPPDVGSEGKEVVDLASEMKHAVGMVIQSDQFPDRLFAPAKRDDLMPDGINPIYDKEMRSELFSQGTLMLRVVIQVSMFVAIPLMAVFFYIWPQAAGWYVCYVLVFNMLVGPVFSADRVTSERERETLELLLTTIVSPWQILWGKLYSGLRVSTVLTMFLVWPILLACLMNPFFWANFATMLAYLVVISLACLTTGTLALFTSVIFRKTSVSLMTAYLVILILFGLPPAVNMFVRTFVVAPRAAAASAGPNVTEKELAAAADVLGGRAPAAEAAAKPKAAADRNEALRRQAAYAKALEIERWCQGQQAAHGTLHTFTPFSPLFHTLISHPVFAPYFHTIARPRNKKRPLRDFSSERPQWLLCQKRAEFRPPLHTVVGCDLRPP